MNLTSDASVFWQGDFINLNLTIVTTWVVIIAMVGLSWLVTRHLSTTVKTTRWQNALEVVILFIQTQIRELGLPKPERYLSFVVTLFMFNAFCAIGNILPGYESPTASLSTTTALAVCVFLAVPFFGISERGLGQYLKRYIEPNFLMLPVNVITEFSRTLALAFRLFGNMASDSMIVGIILLVAPLIFPIVLQVFGLLTGLVQAYIFTILALVYITAAVSGREG